MKLHRMAAALGMAAFLTLPQHAGAQSNTSETYRLLNLFGEVFERVKFKQVDLRDYDIRHA